MGENCFQLFMIEKKISPLEKREEKEKKVEFFGNKRAQHAKLEALFRVIGTDPISFSMEETNICFGTASSRCQLPKKILTGKLYSFKWCFLYIYR